MIYAVFVYEKALERYTRCIVATSADDLLRMVSDSEAYAPVKSLLSIKRISTTEGVLRFHECDHCCGDLVVGHAITVPSSDPKVVYPVSAETISKMSTPQYIAFPQN